MEELLARTDSSDRKSLSLITWVVMLLVSDVPDALWLETTGAVPGWLFWVKACFLAIVIIISLARHKLRPLLPYFLLLLVLMLGIWAMGRVRGLPEFIRWERSIGWTLAMLVYQGMKLVITAIMIAVMLGIGIKRADFYLRKGDLNVPGISVSSIGGSKKVMRWKWLAILCGLIIMPLTFMFFGSLQSEERLIRALPLLPVAVLGAALNAFNEEMQFRAPFLGTLQRLLGDGQAVLLTSFFFGMMHYIGGSPSGIAAY